MAIQQNKDGSFSRWDNDKSEIKRSLSLREKATIKNTSGKAIILPGDGGFEFCELANVGFTNPALMYGFEKDFQVYQNLKQKYPEHQMYKGLIQDKLLRVFGYNEVSYLHLDYMEALNTGTGIGASKGNIFFKSYNNANIKFKDVFADGARLRITACAKPRGNAAYPELWTRTIAYYWFLYAAFYHEIDLYDEVSDIIENYFEEIESLNASSLNNLRSNTQVNESYAHISFAMFLFMHFAMPIEIQRSQLLNVSTYDIVEYINLISKCNYAQSITNIDSEFYKRTDTSLSSPMFSGWCDVGGGQMAMPQFLTNLSEYIIGQQTECT
jgi:hypothetical protein